MKRLELAEITATGLGPAEVVDNAAGFSNVSLGAATNSAVFGSDVARPPKLTPPLRSGCTSREIAPADPDYA